MQNIANAVDKYEKLILAAERYIWENPETGYKEEKTSRYMAEQFEKLGYKLTYAEGITGFYTVLDTGKEGPEVMVLSELDSIICPAHPECDPVTGAVHACGHNAQCATLLGIAAALTEPEITENLCGRIRLCAVPAEELLEIEYRSKLASEGKIKYFVGKTEFLHRGYFDGVDIAFMVHTSTGFAVTKGAVGCIAKKIICKGASAHAGGAPWEGKNALYAATCGINAVNSIRETFKENDIIRVHPIITHGGDMVNAIPQTVTLESYVRGASFDAIINENKKVNRAFCGGALSVGTNVEIIDFPGYAPHTNDDAMMKLACDAAKLAIPEVEVNISHAIGSGSTDMGDLSCLIPTVHPYAGGATGKSHGSDYRIENPELACVKNAKWQLAMLKLLLENGAEQAKKVVASFCPMFKSKEEYLAFVDSLKSSGDRIVYNKDGTANVKTV